MKPNQPVTRHSLWENTALTKIMTTSCDNRRSDGSKTKHTKKEELKQTNKRQGRGVVNFAAVLLDTRKPFMHTVRHTRTNSPCEHRQWQRVVINVARKLRHHQQKARFKVINGPQQNSKLCGSLTVVLHTQTHTTCACPHWLTIISSTTLEHTCAEPNP